MSDYSNLTRKQLESRLRAAERVCVVFGWMPATASQTTKACHELWREWLEISGRSLSPHDNVELHDMIPGLAAMRDAHRAETLRRPRPDGR